MAKNTSAREYIKKVIKDQDMENAFGLQRMVNEHIEERAALPQDIEDKIMRRCHKFGLSRIDYIAGISSSIVAAAEICKKANRQGKAEEAQIAFANNAGLGVVKLPSAGPESIRLIDGEIVYGHILHGTRGEHVTKSFDAYRKKDFISYKWTDGEGGAQDNQARDAIRFLTEAQRYVDSHKNNSVRFVAILDGNYYKRRWPSFSRYSSKRVLVETSDGYAARIGWKKKNM